MMKLLSKKNYLTLIENTAKGENWMFRNLYAIDENGQEKDIYKNGKLSCGIVVSSILYLSKLIGDLHATVASTEKDMVSHGWVSIPIDQLKPGAVIFWDGVFGDDDGKMHDHVGFYLGNEKAMSNDSKGTGFPCIHHYTYNKKRQISRAYWHPSLDEQ